MLMPPLETERLIVRPFTMDDFDAIHQILADWSGSDEPPQAHDERMEWMKWTISWLRTERHAQESTVW